MPSFLCFNYVEAFEENHLIGICGLWILTKYYIGKHIEPVPKYKNTLLPTISG